MQKDESYDTTDEQRIDLDLPLLNNRKTVVYSSENKEYECKKPEYKVFWEGLKKEYQVFKKGKLLKIEDRYSSIQNYLK